MAYSLQTSTSEPQDDITVIGTLLRTISWNNSSNLIASGRQVVMMKILITFCVKSNGHCVMLLWWLLSHDLK